MRAHRELSAKQVGAFRSRLQSLRRDYVHHYAFHDDSDVAWELAERESREIQDIEDALAKLADHTFGICEGCGGEISLSHLEVVPETRYCGACLVEFERSHSVDKREKNV